MQFISRLER